MLPADDLERICNILVEQLLWLSCHYSSGGWQLDDVSVHVRRPYLLPLLAVLRTGSASIVFGRSALIDFEELVENVGRFIHQLTRH